MSDRDPRQSRAPKRSPRPRPRPSTAGARSDGPHPADQRDQGGQRERSTAGRWRRDDLPEAEREAARAAYDGPPIPDDITGEELDRDVRNALRSLPEKLAIRIARHLVASARLLPVDPETAYRHALAARARAARVGIVREACGETAYAAERFKEALVEFQAARRLNGSALYLPMMADCERALGRPDRALALSRDPAVASLDPAGQAEMLIVSAGARRDLGDMAAALRLLEGGQLRSRSRAPEVARLRYAYADTLLAAGRTDPALEWFSRAAAADISGATDAAERVAELEGLTVMDTEAND